MSKESLKIRQIADTMQATDLVSKFIDDSFRDIGNVDIINALNIATCDVTKLHGKYFDQRCFSSMLKQCATIIEQRDAELAMQQAVIHDLRQKLQQLHQRTFLQRLKDYVQTKFADSERRGKKDV